MTLIAKLEQKLKCPDCGSAMVIYDPFVGCQACDSKLHPIWSLGISISVRELRLMFPERVSKRASATGVENGHPPRAVRQKLKSIPGQLELFGDGVFTPSVGGGE